jgi:hypothetical protein
MVGDFNTPGVDCKRGLFLLNSHYYPKLKVDAIYTSTCLLNLSQRTNTVGSSNLLDLIISNLSESCITLVDPGLVKPDNYQPLGLSIFICPLPLLCEITYIRTVNSRLGIIHCIFSQLMTGLLYIVPPLSILLSPASMLLFKILWNRQFPVKL